MNLEATNILKIVSSVLMSPQKMAQLIQLSSPLIIAKDAFNGRFTYTGPLRAVMPNEAVPKREIPEHIPKPDYATEGELIDTIPQKWSGVFGGSVIGKAEEVGRVIAYGLRDVVSERFVFENLVSLTL